MAELGGRLLDGYGLDHDDAAGWRWLKKASAAHSGQVRSTAYDLYARGQRDLAATSFLIIRDDPVSLSNLLYMVRRDEVSPGHPARAAIQLKQLLAGPLADFPMLSAINIALCAVQPFQIKRNWNQAVEWAGSLRDVKGALEWWTDLARNGEAEGHVVLAWLCALHGCTDPDGWTVEERLAEARNDGWDVPESM